MKAAVDAAGSRAFLNNAGELGRLVEQFDWSSTPIGPLDRWPFEMKAVLAFVLRSPTPMVTLWGDTGVMVYNDAYREFAGDRHPGLLGTHVLEGWHEVADFNANVLQKVYREGGTLVFQDQELTLVRDGEPRLLWANLEYSPAFDESGAILGVIAIVIETTERVLAERKALSEQENARVNAERVQLALSAGAIIGTWAWDLPTDRFTIDTGFAHSFGIEPALGHSGLTLETIIATVHPDDRTALLNAIEEAIARGGAYAHQYRVRRHDGIYYWIEANGRVDMAADGSPSNFRGVLIDVDGRRTVEAERDHAIAMLRTLNEQLEQRVDERTRELTEAQDALRQSQKMEAVGQLTGGLAHDFNNLLGSISGALQLIGLRLAQGRRDDVDRYVDVARGAVKRAAALTHRLLAFSRRQTLDPKPTNIKQLVSGMEELIRRTVGPSVELAVLGVGRLWPALVDPSQLENALLNLCLNARDAMPAGGCITIETRNQRLDRDTARALDLGPGEYLSLSVTDNGAGMPPEIIERVFEPFFTTKPIGQGTGLGLSMIYGFAKQSGGQVHIESEVGAGTTVCIYLPRHHAEGEVDEEAVVVLPPARSNRGETILVVDDEPTVRMLVADVLQDLGYSVIEAADSMAGLKILQSDVRVDLLVSDVGLPGGMDGRQMADAARARRPELRVLFLTGYAKNAAIGNGQLEAGMAVMTKPFLVEALAARVKEMITGT